MNRTVISGNSALSYLKSDKLIVQISIIKISFLIFLLYVIKFVSDFWQVRCFSGYFIAGVGLGVLIFKNTILIVTFKCWRFHVVSLKLRLSVFINLFHIYVHDIYLSLFQIIIIIIIIISFFFSGEGEEVRWEFVYIKILHTMKLEKVVKKIWVFLNYVMHEKITLNCRSQIMQCFSCCHMVIRIL